MNIFINLFLRFMISSLSFLGKVYFIFKLTPYKYVLYIFIASFLDASSFLPIIAKTASGMLLCGMVKLVLTVYGRRSVFAGGVGPFASLTSFNCLVKLSNCLVNAVSSVSFFSISLLIFSSSVSFFSISFFNMSSLGTFSFFFLFNVFSSVTLIFSRSVFPILDFLSAISFIVSVKVLFNVSSSVSMIVLLFFNTVIVFSSFAIRCSRLSISCSRLSNVCLAMSGKKSGRSFCSRFSYAAINSVIFESAVLGFFFKLVKAFFSSQFLNCSTDGVRSPPLIFFFVLVGLRFLFFFVNLV